MKPDWQTSDGRIQLYCGDCLKILPEIGKVDAVITDPPYGINAHVLQPPSDSYRKRTKRNPSKRLNAGSGKLKNRLLNNSDCGWDCQAPEQDCFRLLFELSINQIIWGGNYFPLPPTRGILAWDKQQPWENFSQFEMAWTSFDFPAKIFRFNKSLIPDKQHPTQKPLPLMIWCIGLTANAQTILDPYMGSGTTGIACIRTKRRFIGIEISPEYFEIARKRIEIELQQGVLDL
jgi:site-specific DNA-methyltransferase (adenine-specific)